jgi:hypothetical protein
MVSMTSRASRTPKHMPMTSARITRMTGLSFSLVIVLSRR